MLLLHNTAFRSYQWQTLRESDCRVMQYRGAFVYPVLQWKGNKYYIFWVCFVALFILHPKRMCHNVFSSVACLSVCLSVLHFPIILLHDTIVRKKLLNTLTVLIFSWNFSYTFLILWEIQRNIFQVHKSSCGVSFVLVRNQWKLNFLDRFSKNPHISNFVKICPVGIELFHADKRTDILYEASSRFP